MNFTIPRQRKKLIRVHPLVSGLVVPIHLVDVEIFHEENEGFGAGEDSGSQFIQY